MNIPNTLNIQELYSKWAMNEQTGARYRTISLCVAKNNFNHIFAVEVLSDCRRRLITSDRPEFSGVVAECLRIETVVKNKKSVRGVTCNGDVSPNTEIL
jgi:hypothetical protein